MSAENTERPRIILHWLNKSRSQRILWLLEELKVEYEMKIYKRGGDMLAPPEMKEIHPLGKAPILEVRVPGRPKPIILAESGAITEFLVDHFGQHLVPKKYAEGKEGQLGGETEEWLRYRYYMHYNEGTFMLYMVVALLVSNIKNAPVPFFIKPIARQIAGKIEDKFLTPNFKNNFKFLEDQLSTSPDGGEFLCGKTLTAADILMSFPLEASFSRAGLGTDEKEYPKLVAYLKKLQEADSYKNATKKAEEMSGESHKVLE